MKHATPHPLCKLHLKCHAYGSDLRLAFAFLDPLYLMKQAKVVLMSLAEANEVVPLLKKLLALTHPLFQLKPTVNLLQVFSVPEVEGLILWLQLLTLLLEGHLSL